MKSGSSKGSKRRAATPSPAPISVLFEPRSVAVVGASRRPGSIGAEILRNLVSFGFRGPVYPVNRAAEVVLSSKAYPCVSAIPDPVDLAVIAVPREFVLDVVKDCGKKGVKGLVVITAGFKEAGHEGVAREDELRRLTRSFGMRVIGPNCMGLINAAEDVRLNASFAGGVPLPGRVAFATQSGALGEAILADARDLGLGIAKFASIGNIVDVTATDLVEAFGADPAIDVILLYIESFGDPRRFTQIARSISRDKPILVVKSGRSAAGARAAASHTGSLVGRDIAVESLLEQCGVLRAQSVRELFTMASAFANQPMPKGDRVAIVTNAGGPGILATDACAGLGLSLATFSKATRKALERALPEGAATQNPVDLIADADATRFQKALTAVGKDPGVDAILALFVSPVTTDALAVARTIAAAPRSSGKTTLACFMGKEQSDEGVRILRDASVPVYRFPEEAASALAAMCRWRRYRERKQGVVPKFRVDAHAARKVVADALAAGRTLLLGGECDPILRAYGLPVARSIVADDVGAAMRFANEVGYPVVLKAESSAFVHKTEIGGVRANLENGDQVFEAFSDLERRLKPKAADLRIRAQQQVKGHAEVILGASTDPVFGPLLLFGLGGVYVEVLRDVAVRVHPITDVDAFEMIRSIRGWPLLSGARGAKPVDVAFLEEMLLRLSCLVGDLDDVAELDLNPLIIGADARNAAVVDARIRLRPKERG